MADLSVETDRNYRDPTFSSWEVVATKTVVKGSFCTLNTQSHGTSGSRGRIQQFTGAAGEFPIGFHADRRSGVVTGEDPVLAGAQLTPDIIDVPVTGIAGDRTDLLLEVYVTAGGVFTLTRPAAPNDEPVGVVLRYHSTALAGVYFFGLAAQLALALAGGTAHLMHLGSYGPYAAGSGNVATGIPAPCHGRFLTVFGQVARIPTDGDCSHSFNLEIGGTNVTGGVVTWLFSDALGAKLAGTAITAANEFHRGDLIDVEVVVNTAGTATDPGLLNLFATYETLPGL